MNDTYSELDEFEKRRAAEYNPAISQKALKGALSVLAKTLNDLKHARDIADIYAEKLIEIANTLRACYNRHPELQLPAPLDSQTDLHVWAALSVDALDAELKDACVDYDALLAKYTRHFVSESFGL